MVSCLTLEHSNIDPNFVQSQEQALNLTGNTFNYCHYLGESKNLYFEYSTTYSNVTIKIPITNSKIYHVALASNFVTIPLTGPDSDLILIQITKPEVVKQGASLNMSLIYPMQLNDTLKGMYGTFEDLGFKVGPLYSQVTLQISSNFLTNQRIIYFQADDGRDETVLFSIKNSEIVECVNMLIPTRAENLSYVAMGCIGAIYVIFLAISLVFITQQPLKSRGLIPFITIFCLFTELALGIRFWFYPMSLQSSMCLFFAFGHYPLNILLYLTLLAYFIRYYSIINLNRTKNSSTTNRTEKSMSIQVRIVKYVARDWFITMFLLLTCSIVFIVFLVLIMIDFWGCSFETLFRLKVANAIVVSLIFLIMFGLLIFDALANAHYTLRCNWFGFLLYKDPHYFRIQITFFMIFIPLYLFKDYFFLVGKNSLEGTSFVYLPTMILNTIVAVILLIINVVIPNIATIILFIQKMSKKKIKTNPLLDLLKNPETHAMFVEFCKYEYSVENILCWEDIQSYKACQKSHLDIYGTYLWGNRSIYEVNVSKACINAVFEKIKAGNTDSDLFDDIEKAVVSNLYDTYSRFSTSDNYMEYLKEKAIEKELYDVDNIAQVQNNLFANRVDLMKIKMEKKDYQHVWIFFKKYSALITPFFLLIFNLLQVIMSALDWFYSQTDRCIPVQLYIPIVLLATNCLVLLINYLATATHLNVEKYPKLSLGVTILKDTFLILGMCNTIILAILAFVRDLLMCRL